MAQAISAFFCSAYPATAAFYLPCQLQLLQYCHFLPIQQIYIPSLSLLQVKDFWYPVSYFSGYQENSHRATNTVWHVLRIGQGTVLVSAWRAADAGFTGFFSS